MPKKNEVYEHLRILRSKELRSLSRTPSIAKTVKCKRVRWAEHIAWMKETSKSYGILVGKGPLGKPIKRSEYTNCIAVDHRYV